MNKSQKDLLNLVDLGNGDPVVVVDLGIGGCLGGEEHFEQCY